LIVSTLFLLSLSHWRLVQNPTIFAPFTPSLWHNLALPPPVRRGGNVQEVDVLNPERYIPLGHG